MVSELQNPERTQRKEEKEEKKKKKKQQRLTVNQPSTNHLSTNLSFSLPSVVCSKWAMRLKQFTTEMLHPKAKQKEKRNSKRQGDQQQTAIFPLK